MAINNRRNPYNSENVLFRSLTRLLSGPITDYRQQNPRQLKRQQLDKYKFKSASGLPFKKAVSNPLNQIYLNQRSNQNRAERYIDFDQMDYDPLISSCLDIYASAMTTSSALSKLLTINCPNEEIKAVLEHLYYSVMNIEFNLFGWCRSLAKFGDSFYYLDIDEKEGIKHFIGLPPMEVERLEGEDKTNPGYVQYQWNSGGLTFENWQIAHFRILTHDKYNPYGVSVLDGARRIFRQYNLILDAVMAYRVVRSSERRVFKIDVGGIQEKDVEQHMQKIITDLKRNQIVDETTGQIDLRYSAASAIDHDYFIPVIGGQTGTSIETLPGGTYNGDLDDIKFLRDNMLAALKVPHAYLVSTGDSMEDKTTLSQKDIEFAHLIQRLQRSVISELEKIGVIQLYTLGYRGKDLLSFKLKLNNPSKISEITELEHWKMKFETAAAATEGYFSRRWVAKNILDISDDVFLRNIRERYYDTKVDADLEKIATEANAELQGELGGDEGGSDGGGDETDSMLLTSPDDQQAAPQTGDATPPGKRHEPYLTPGAKGKLYKPEINDKRQSGARKRNLLGLASREMASSTMRNTHKGYSDMASLAKGVYEELQTNYQMIQEKEDLKLQENNKEIKLLIESLTKNKNKDEI